MKLEEFKATIDHQPGGRFVNLSDVPGEENWDYLPPEDELEDAREDAAIAVEVAAEELEELRSVVKLLEEEKGKKIVPCGCVGAWEDGSKGCCRCKGTGWQKVDAA